MGCLVMQMPNCLRLLVLFFFSFLSSFPPANVPLQCIITRKEKRREKNYRKRQKKGNINYKLFKYIFELSRRNNKMNMCIRNISFFFISFCSFLLFFSFVCFFIHSLFSVFLNFLLSSLLLNFLRSSVHRPQATPFFPLCA